MSTTQSNNPLSPVLILALKYLEVKNARASTTVDFKNAQDMENLFPVDMTVVKKWMGGGSTLASKTGKAMVPDRGSLTDDQLKEAERIVKLAIEVGRLFHWSAIHLLAFAIYHHHYAHLFMHIREEELAAERVGSLVDCRDYSMRWLRSFYMDRPEIQSEELEEALEDWPGNIQSEDFSVLFKKVKRR